MQLIASTRVRLGRRWSARNAPNRLHKFTRIHMTRYEHEHEHERSTHAARSTRRLLKHAKRTRLRERTRCHLSGFIKNANLMMCVRSSVCVRVLCVACACACLLAYERFKVHSGHVRESEQRTRTERALTTQQRASRTSPNGKPNKQQKMNNTGKMCVHAHNGLPAAS